MWRSNNLPARVAKYNVNHSQHLGEGRYGVVTLGRHAEDGREVAIKRITLPDYDLLAQIKEEVEKVQAIEHRNVIKLLHYEKIEQHTFFVLERCDCDLQTFAYRNPSFQSLKSQVMQNCADAVQCIHDHEIIHRDLKPENVLMKGSGGGSWVAKISDFGYSRRVPDGVGSASFSATGGIGTTAWMAPEVIPSVSGHSRYSKPADVYSLGLLNLSVAHHQGPGEYLEPWKEQGQYMGEWMMQHQQQFPDLSLAAGSSRVMQDVQRRLITQMLQPTPARRCNIRGVCEEMRRIRSGEVPDMSSSASHGTQADEQTLSSAQTAPSTETAEVFAARTDTAAAAASGRLQLQKVSCLKMPIRGMLNYGMGQNLDGLWLKPDVPDCLHYYKFREGSMQEVWEEAMPEGQLWHCRKFISSQHVLLQSLSNQVSVYQRHNLQFVQQLSSPGYVCGLLDGGGDAVVGNHASPSSYTQGVRLYVSPATDLQHCATELQTPDQPYSRADFLWACGNKDGGGIAVTSDRDFVDVYSYAGKHIKRVGLPGPSRRPSCTSSHVLVPVRTSPPMIQVLSWEGQLLQTLGPEELSLRDNEWCWSVSPLHDGKINVLVTDTTEQDYIHTYQVEDNKTGE